MKNEKISAALIIKTSWIGTRDKEKIRKYFKKFHPTSLEVGRPTAFILEHFSARSILALLTRFYSEVHAWIKAVDRVEFKKPGKGGKHIAGEETFEMSPELAIFHGVEDTSYHSFQCGWIQEYRRCAKMKIKGEWWIAVGYKPRGDDPWFAGPAGRILFLRPEFSPAGEDTPYDEELVLADRFC